MNLNEYQLKNFGRIDFKPEEFERLIYQRGARVLWEKAIFCSCINEETGSADFICPACKGKGFLYFDPQEIRAAVSSINQSNDATPIGLIDVGTSFVTTMAKDQVNFRDRITFLDFRTVYSQVLTYQDPVVNLKYKAEEIMSIRVLSSEIPKEQYKLSEDGWSIEFEEGVFGFDDRFSILMKVKPTYIVIDMPHELRGTFIKFGHPDEEWVLLPKQLMIKREDLLPLKRGEL